jgi:hypothetical protein
MKHILSILISTIFLFGCDGLNSSFKKNGSEGGVNNPPVTQKPGVCKFDFSNTCWAESMQKVTSCLGTSPTGEVFSETKEFCTGPTGKLVAFSNPAEMFGVPFDSNYTPIDFRVFPDSVKECLSVSGTAQKFKVTLAQTKETIEFDFSGNELKFTCLDGQSVQIPYEVFENCSQAQGEKFIATVPGIEMKRIQDNSSAVWKFRFRGSPQSPDVFSCQE